MQGGEGVGKDGGRKIADVSGMSIEFFHAAYPRLCWPATSSSRRAVLFPIPAPQLRYSAER
eukprot:3047248-Rhodomonas_salina.1